MQTRVNPLGSVNRIVIGGQNALLPLDTCTAYQFIRSNLSLPISGFC